MTKSVVVDLPHQLGRQEARKRLEAGFHRLREQFAGKPLTFEEHWEADRLHFHAGILGQNVTGRVDVLEQNIHMELDLPWIFAVLAGQVQSRLKKEGQLLLAPPSSTPPK